MEKSVIQDAASNSLFKGADWLSQFNLNTKSDSLAQPLKPVYRRRQFLALINFISELTPVLKSNGFLAGRGALRAEPGWICEQPIAPFITICLLSNTQVPPNIFLPASSMWSLPISKSLTRFNGSIPNPSSSSICGGLLLIISDSVSRSSSFSQIESTFVGYPLSRRLTSADPLIRFSKP
jgi:hypothetical protein